MSKYSFPDRSSLVTKRIWSLCRADRIVLSEQTSWKRGVARRQFAANHVAVTWDEAGVLVEVHAAGVIQCDGQDCAGFVGETWRAEPFPQPVLDMIAAAAEAVQPPSLAADGLER